MVSRIAVLFTACFMLLAGIACGGGADTASQGPLVTDPAAVPSAAPIQNAILYQLRGREIIVEGISTLVSDAPPTTPRSYTVVDGDTCSGIAEKLGVGLDELIAANQIINAGCTNLRPNDVLRIPAGATNDAAPQQTPTPPRGSGQLHTVEPGNTCSGIAQSFNVSAEDLIAANGLDADCQGLQPGQILIIP